MPDNDRFPRNVRAAWKDAQRLALSLDEPLRVGDLSAKAIASSLRQDGGCPGIRELAVAVRDAALYGPGLLSDQAQVFVDRSGRRGLALSIRDEAQLMLSTQPGTVQGMSDEQVAHELTVRGLRRFALAEMWSRGRDQLMDRLDSMDRVHDYEQRCLDATPLDALARSLLRNPDGQGLRAPNRRAATPPTPDLLGEDFGA